MVPNTITLYKDFSFDSSHNLPCVPDGHAGGNLHGHTWKLTIGVSGDLDPKRGWILDFKDIKNLVKEHVIDRLDHHHLNDVLENPTSENLVHWVWAELWDRIALASDNKARLVEVTIWETPTSRCTLTA